MDHFKQPKNLPSLIQTDSIVPDCTADGQPSISGWILEASGPFDGQRQPGNGSGDFMREACKRIRHVDHADSTNEADDDDYCEKGQHEGEHFRVVAVGDDCRSIDDAEYEQCKQEAGEDRLAGSSVETDELAEMKHVHLVGFPQLEYDVCILT